MSLDLSFRVSVLLDSSKYKERLSRLLALLAKLILVTRTKMASSSSSSAPVSLVPRQNIWPDSWPSVGTLLDWGAQLWEKQPTHVFEPILDQDRKCVLDMIPELKLVANPSAFMIFARTQAKMDEKNFPFLRFHCTNMWAAQSILAAPEPYRNKLLVGFACNKGVPGIYVSETPEGALYYAHGSKSLRGLCALLIVQTTNAGEKLSSKNNRVLKSLWMEGQSVIGAIFFRSLHPPKTNSPKPLDSFHALKYASAEQLASCGRDYVQHCLTVFGCDSNGAYAFETKSSTDVYTEWPKYKIDLPIIELEISAAQEAVLDKILSINIPPKSTNRTDMYLSWKHRQQDFVDEGWELLPPQLWYCRTKSGKVCIYDSATEATSWPPKKNKAPDESVSLPIPPSQTCQPILDDPPLSLPSSGKGEALLPDFDDEDSVPGIEPKVDLEGAFTPRLFGLLQSRQHLLSSSDYELTLTRLVKAEFVSCVCAHLFDDSTHAQREIILFGDPGPCRKLVGDIFHAAHGVCRLQTKKRVLDFQVPSQPSQPPRPSQVPLVLPKSGPTVLPLPVQQPANPIAQEPQGQYKKMFDLFFSVLSYTDLGKQFSGASTDMQARLKAMFAGRIQTLSLNVVKDRIRCLQRWLKFCEDANIQPFPVDPLYCAMMANELKEKGQTVASSFVTQLTQWCELLGNPVVLMTNPFIQAACLGQPADIKQANPLSLLILLFWERALTDPRPIIRWIAVTWLILAYGILRFAHVQRSEISSITCNTIVGFCPLGKARRNGKRSPFRWAMGRKGILPDTDIANTLSLLQQEFKFSSNGILPDISPRGASFDTVTGFLASPMPLSKFHRLSLQILKAAGLDSSTAVSSYSARRLMPSLAELWHAPEEWRNKLGGWNRDEVQAKPKSSSNMPNLYAAFRLESAADLKRQLVGHLANTLDTNKNLIWTDWPSFCQTYPIMDFSTSASNVKPTVEGKPQIQTDDESSSDSSSSSSSCSSSEAGEDDTPLTALFQHTAFEWISLPSVTSVIHARSDEPVVSKVHITLCKKSIISTVTGSTLESASRTGKQFCNNCWPLLTSEIRSKILHDMSTLT